MLVLPATVFLDWMLKGYILSWQAFLGVAGIVVGFVLLVLSEAWQVRQAGRSQTTPPPPRQHDNDFSLASINVSTRSSYSLSASVRLKLNKYII